MEALNGDEHISSIKIRFPGRHQQIDNLLKVFGEPSHFPWRTIFVYGHAATGKSSILKALMECLKLHYVWVNCIETYNQRLLLESISKQLCIHNKCENVCDFIRILKQSRREHETTLYLVLDNAERVRDLPDTLVASLFRLQELCESNVCTILLSEIVWEKFSRGIGYEEPLSLHFSEYSREELLSILLLDRPENFSEEFYSSYLKMVLGVFFLASRDVRELRHIAVSNFSEYCRPLESGEAVEKDARKLWLNIEPTLRRALDSVYLRDTSFARVPVELPFYSKFLLLAAYLASYNPLKSDRRFFLKNQGRSKTKKQKRSNPPNQHLKGPKVFPLRRLLAIFYVIVGERVEPSVSLFSEIGSLVTLRLLASCGEGPNDPKYKCLVGLESVRDIARTVGFDIVQHLYDFT